MPLSSSAHPVPEQPVTTQGLPSGVPAPSSPPAGSSGVVGTGLGSGVGSGLAPPQAVEASAAARDRHRARTGFMGASLALDLVASRSGAGHPARDQLRAKA